MSVEAENPRARIGGNFPPDDPDERAPPKHLRIVTQEDAFVFRVVVRLLATLFELARWRVTEKRKGGDEGRAVRCIAIGYMRGVNFPVWKLEMMWELNRKQVGQEEEAYLRMRSDNAFLDEQLEHIETMLDRALMVKAKELLSESTAEIVSIIETRRRAKKDRSEAKKLAAEEKAKKPPPPPVAPPSRADLILSQANAKHQMSRLRKEVKIHLAVIHAGTIAGATKDQKRDAKQAAIDLEKAGREITKLERANAPKH
jgi:hypothetical protein